MAERDMAAALSASLHAEEDSIAQRIAKAEQVLGGGHEAPSRKPEHTKLDSVPQLP